MLYSILILIIILLLLQKYGRGVLYFLLLIPVFIFGVSILIVLMPILIIIFLLFKGNFIKFEKFNYSNYSGRNYNTYANYNNYAYNENEYEKACEVLGGNINNTYDELKKMRNNLLKKYHPDFYNEGLEKEKATEKTNKINNAWEIIERYHNKK